MIILKSEYNSLSLFCLLFSEEYEYASETSFSEYTSYYFSHARNNRDHSSHPLGTRTCLILYNRRIHPYTPRRRRRPDPRTSDQEK
jgi:hypothetical protein